jgi:hypothetical protein
MKRITVLLLLLVSFTAMACAEEKHDGWWWVQQTPSTKAGYLLGYGQGESDGLRYLCMRMVGAHDIKAGDAVTCADAFTKQISIPSSKSIPTTVEDMRNRVDAFYGDLRHKDLPMWVAVKYVERQLSDEDIKQMGH